MKPYSKDMAGWSEVIMLAVIVAVVTPPYCLWWLFVELPGKIWRWFK